MVKQRSSKYIFFDPRLFLHKFLSKLQKNLLTLTLRIVVLRSLAKIIGQYSWLSFFFVTDLRIIQNSFPENFTQNFRTLPNAYFWYFSWERSSRLEVFCRKGILRNFSKFTGKHLCQSLFFNKVAGLSEPLFQ